VHLAVGMPANERMDWLVEKATELGVASIQPLATAHGVLRLSGERAEKKRAHWEAIAIAACEQCGRNRVPVIHPVQSFLGQFGMDRCPGRSRRRAPGAEPGRRHAGHPDGAVALTRPPRVLVLSGPEGGLSGTEEQQAIARGFAPVTLGARVLRAETAALAALVFAGL
jgi:16S rRNA (uracil1498-N3)-methyltransferase